MSKRQHKDTINAWKDKAIERRKEIDKLKKRIKELEKSRDNWKSKYKEVKTIDRKKRVMSDFFIISPILLSLCLSVF